MIHQHHHIFGWNLLLLSLLLLWQTDHTLERNVLSTFLSDVYADEGKDDEGKEENEHRHRGRGERKKSIPIVANPTYAKECSGCHFAYQPGLLPARSWENIMATLKDHFGDNAELAEEDVQEIKNYLMSQAAEVSSHSLSKRIIQSAKGKVFLRITEIPYIAHEHQEELSDRMVTQNPQVKSLSHCDKCHTQAAQGSYTEREITIPGYTWRDQ